MSQSLQSTEIIAEITSMVTDAKQIPFSSNASIDRNKILTLLRELESVLPDDVVSASTIIASGDQTIAEANMYADTTRTEADNYYTDTLNKADGEAQSIVDTATHDAEVARSTAEHEAATMVENARQDAIQHVDDANRRADDILSRADRDAQVTVEAAERQAAALVDNAHQEAKRLVAESAIVDTANEQARRILDDAHTIAATYQADVDHHLETRLINMESLARALAEDCVNYRKDLRGRIPDDYYSDDYPQPDND